MDAKALIEQRRQQLSPAKRALLERQLRGLPGAEQAPQTIPRRAGTDPAPLSYAQQRFWLLQQLTPGTTAFNTIEAMRLIGPLDLEAVRTTVSELFRRHALLRTVYRLHEGALQQHVRPWEPGWELPCVDLRALPPAEREVEVRRLVESAAQVAFNLAEDLPAQVQLLRITDHEHLLLLTIHHIAYDGWSSSLLNREIAVLYAACAAGQPSPLAEPALQYADFAAWQREPAQEARMAAQLDYWRQTLAGPLPVLELPTDRLRPSVQSFRGRDESLMLSPELTASLRAFAGEAEVTPFMLLLAAYAALLARHSGQDELLIGAPIAGRPFPELEQIVGPFLNQIALRVGLAGDPGFHALLRHVRAVSLGAFAHQELPFEKIVEALKPERDPRRSLVYQAMFLYQNFPRAGFEHAGITLEPFAFEREALHGDAQCDLTLIVDEHEQTLELTLVYDASLFAAATIRRMLVQLERILAAVQADLPLSALPLLTPDEREELLYGWNATAGPQPTAPVHRLIAAQAARTPEAIAVVHGERALSYGELAARSAQLAAYLGTHGVGPGSYVGLCGERSPEMLVALLGVLQAGAAYVPLDPRYPAERLAHMLREAHVAVLLTQASMAEAFAAEGRTVIALDADWPAIATASAAPASLDNLATAAYVIFTSGSTGAPKGVVIPHHALASYTLAARDAYGFGPGDRVLQFASLSFDASAEEIFPTLISGGTLVLRTDAQIASPAGFFQSCADWGLTVLDLPTAYWHELSSALPDQLAQLAGVRLLIIGGERALPTQFAAWRSAVPHLRLVNTYGPTEATIVATAYEQAGTAVLDGEVPIGRPVRNARAYVLDEALRPLPVGIVGELYLGGAGIADGYLGHPRLTAERFLPDPFGTAPGARLYRTGDLARYRPDGVLLYAGRADQQVKIRGFRVEPGEIEALLRSHPAVRDAAVVAREDGTTQRRLVAYAVPAAWPAGGAMALDGLLGELRALLAERLPDYMVPAALLPIEALPLTTNGKLDLRALPDASGGRLGLRQPYLAPRTPVEQMLVELWSALMHVEATSVGVHDSFFELGGHSLLVAQAIHQIDELFAIQMPLRVIFDTPTIAQLAITIEEQILSEVEQAESGQADSASPAPTL